MFKFHMVPINKLHGNKGAIWHSEGDGLIAQGREDSSTFRMSVVKNLIISTKLETRITKEETIRKAIQH
jgi:hypothetical protein